MRRIMVVPGRSSFTWRREFCVGPFLYDFDSIENTDGRMNEWISNEFWIVNQIILRRINRLQSGLEWRAAPGQRIYWFRWRNWTSRWASRSRPSWQEERLLRPRSTTTKFRFQPSETRKKKKKIRLRFNYHGGPNCRNGIFVLNS